MNYTKLNKYKLSLLNEILSIDSFKSSFINYWKPLIDNRIGNNPENIFHLAEELSAIFTSIFIPGRSQSTLSMGGSSWERLIVWYLNLVFWNTNTCVLTSKKNLVPEVIKNSTTVTIHNFQTNTESDIYAFSVPSITDQEVADSITPSKISSLIKQNTKKCSVSVIQCKTNWNDNAQIPMLWDMIYRVETFRDRNHFINIGTGGYSPSSFKSFNYSFVTVPTVKKEFKPNHLTTLRVKHISGGNYWGKKTKNGVSSCINEFFNRNFKHVFETDIITHLRKLDNKIIKKFIDLDFQ